jgi:hypothetical protein
MKKNHLTIIFMKDTNRPVTLEISIKLIILLIALFVVFSSTYVFFIGGYHKLSHDNRELEEKIRSMKFQISKLESDISKLDSESGPGINSMNLSGTAIVVEDPLEKKREVGVQELKLESNPIDGRLKFYFILNNTTDNNRMVRGYVFVVLKDVDNPNYYESYPKVKFINGHPQNYHLGDPYSIKRFKEYRGVLELKEDADILEVFVYSEVGELLLRIRHEL